MYTGVLECEDLNIHLTKMFLLHSQSYRFTQQKIKKNISQRSFKKLHTERMQVHKNINMIVGVCLKQLFFLF